jgi:hypothetical protein
VETGKKRISDSKKEGLSKIDDFEKGHGALQYPHGPTAANRAFYRVDTQNSLIV